MMQEAKRLRFEQPLEALRLYAEAANRCWQEGRLPELIQALKGQGQIERDLGETDEALALYIKAAAICRQQDDPLLLAHTLRHIGDIQQEAGHDQLALPFYREALEIYRQHPDTNLLDRANAIRPLAALKERMGDLVAAKGLWQEAKELYAATNISEGVTECTGRLALLNRSAGA